MDMQVTIDDPQTYLEPFTATVHFTLQPDTELLEGICDNEKIRSTSSVSSANRKRSTAWPSSE